MTILILATGVVTIAALLIALTLTIAILRAQPAPKIIHKPTPDEILKRLYILAARVRYP